MIIESCTGEGPHFVILMSSQFVDLARRTVGYNKVLTVADKGLEDLGLVENTYCIDCETIISNELFCET